MNNNFKLDNEDEFASFELKGPREVSVKIDLQLTEESKEELRRLCAQRELHRESIEPNRAPDNIIVRACTQNALLFEVILNVDEDEPSVSDERCADVTAKAVERGQTVWTYFYDGDTGECTGTLIAKPSAQAIARLN